MERHAGLPYAFLAGTESPKVLRRQRVRVGEELYHDTPDRFGADGDVEQNSRLFAMITGFRISTMLILQASI